MKINEIYLGDCLELIPKHVEDKSIDMIFCDLPYGTTQNKWDSVIPLDELWKEYNRVIKDNGAIVLFAQTPFDKVLGVSNLKMLKYEWVWEKTQATGHLNAKKMPMKAHENILVFYKKLPTYNPQKTTGHKPMNNGVRRSSLKNENYNEINKVDLPFGGDTDRYPRTVLEFKSDKQKNYLHPTQKPLSLIEYMIKTYTNEGDLILDNTCGSGTTGLGAKNLNRNYIMMEQDPKYYEITCKRVQG
jgi:site-specific DNA-methyltransferase (adenine-specific)